MELSIQIAGLSMLMQACHAEAIDLPNLYAPFVTRQPRQAVDIRIQVHEGFPSTPETGTPLFVAQRPGGSSPSWKLFETQGSYVIEAIHSKAEQFRRRWVVCQKDYSAARLYLDFKTPPASEWPFPLRFPLDQVLWLNALATRGGVLLHACAVVLEGDGLVFFGPQESGKSTMAGLWQGHPNARVLSDECIAIRVIDDKFYVFGTPWSGGTQSAAYGGVPICALFYISHGPQNKATPKQAVDTVRELTLESFLPRYDRIRMEFCLDLFTRIGQSLPVFDLAFVPTREIVDFITHRVLAHCWATRVM